jgi:hypothetical protein
VSLGAAKFVAPDFLNELDNQMKPHITRVFENGRVRWIILVGDQAIMFKNYVCEQRSFSFSAACLIAQCAFGQLDRIPVAR